MVQLLRQFLPIFLSLSLLIAANGLCNTLIPLRLHLAGHTADTIGYVTSALYIGIFLGSLRLDRWIAKAGLLYALIVCTLGMTFLTLLKTLWVDPIYWAALRLGVGVASAGVFIVIESWLLLQTKEETRSAILSIYLMVFYLALSGGQLLIHTINVETIAPFCLIAALSLFSIIPLLGKKQAEPILDSPKPLNLKKLFFISPLGFGGVTISGIILAVMYGLLPVYARDLGLSITHVGNLLAVLIFGGLCFQWPLSKLADWFGRRTVLNGISLCAILLALILATNPTLPLPLLFLSVFFFGGVSFTIYPISMAYTCENVARDELVAATGGFVLIYGVGAMLGPIIAPLAMQVTGSHGLFYFVGLTMAILLFVGIVHHKFCKLPQS